MPWWGQRVVEVRPCDATPGREFQVVPAVVDNPDSGGLIGLAFNIPRVTLIRSVLLVLCVKHVRPIFLVRREHCGCVRIFIVPLRHRRLGRHKGCGCGGRGGGIGPPDIRIVEAPRPRRWQTDPTWPTSGALSLGLPLRSRRRGRRCRHRPQRAFV